MKTQIRLGYEEVLIDLADLPKLLEILDNASQPAVGYVNDEQIHYLKDEGFSLSYGPPSVVGGYVTEEEYLRKYEAEQEKG